MAYAVMHGMIHLNAHRFSLCSLLHDLFYRCQEIRGFIDFNFEIRIAGNPERERCNHIHSRRTACQDVAAMISSRYTKWISEASSPGYLRDRRNPDKTGEKVCRDFDPCKKILFIQVPDDNGKVKGKI